MFNFCVLRQEPISLSSFLTCYKKREWQKNLAFEHIMRFAEPVLGGTRGHGGDLPSTRTPESCLPLPCLLWSLPDRGRLREAGAIVSLSCWSLETPFHLRGHEEPCWQWCCLPIFRDRSVPGPALQASAVGSGRSGAAVSGLSLALGREPALPCFVPVPLAGGLGCFSRRMQGPKSKSRSVKATWDQGLALVQSPLPRTLG